MSLTIEQTDAAIRNTFYNMEEGVEYVLNDFWFAELNRVRKVYGYSPVKNRQEYKFSRKGDIIFVNNSSVFDFDGKHNLALAFAFAFALAFASEAIAIALQHNGIEKLNNCDGKIVEIDGKKYKLTAV